MHRPSEISMCALKLLFFQEFSSQKRRIVLRAVANLLRCRPAGYIPAGRHGAWRSLVAHLLWEQRVGGSNPSAPTTFTGAHSGNMGDSQRLAWHCLRKLLYNPRAFPTSMCFKTRAPA